MSDKGSSHTNASHANAAAETGNGPDSPPRPASAIEPGPNAAISDADSLDLPFGRWLFAQSCGFLAGVATMEQMPAFEMPEVAFAGRSNVGKSSLLNQLVGRKALAKISSNPGKTRAVNYFLVEESYYFVDLPGFGYAKASKSERQAWARLMYLAGESS